MSWIIYTLLVIWLAPVAWVVQHNWRQRRRYGMATSVRDLLAQARRMLAWPLGVIDWIRGL